MVKNIKFNKNEPDSSAETADHSKILKTADKLINLRLIDEIFFDGSFNIKLPK